MLDRGWTTAVCCASGPSIDSAQAEIIRRAQAASEGRVRVIAINDTWRLAPFADVLFACDERWWDVNVDAVKAGFGGERWTVDKAAAAKYGLHQIPGVRGNAAPIDGVISHGSNSGFQAIGLAYVFGARRIVLAGYDMQRTGGRAHWHGDHQKPLSQGNPQGWIPHFYVLSLELKRLGVDVVNCSAATALTCFRRGDLSAELA